MGLMPAHRGGDEPLFSLKEIVIAPSNSRARARPAPGRRAPPRRRDRASCARSSTPRPITEIRTAAVSAVATKLLARPGFRRVAILGAGVQARSHAEAMRDDRRRPRPADLEPHAGARRGARARVARRRLRDDRGGARRRRRRLHVHVVARADRAPRVARSRHARERRGLVRPVGARARCRRRRRGRALRRPARVDPERVRRLPRGRRGSRHRARPHPRRARRAAGRLAPGSPRRRRADGVQVARARRRGPRRRGALRRAGAASAGSAPRCEF